MKFFPLIVVLVLSGCSTTRDPHAPKTVVADANGGSVTVAHGQHLRIPLAGDGKGGFEWRRVEPRIMAVMQEGPADPQGLNFTPVRTGNERLRFEYRPMSGEGAAQRTVSYDITVR